MSGRRFTLIDLIALLLCVIFVIGILMPSVNRTRDYAWFILCQSNLHQIGQGFLLYSQQNNGQLPRTRWDPTSSQVNSFTQPLASDPFALNGPAPNDVTASLYLPIRQNLVSAKLFLCPLTKLGDNFQEAPGATSRSNFLGPQELGYSMANPFPTSEPAIGEFHWDTKLSAEFALVADMNPGKSVLSVPGTASESQMEKANSLNHYRVGGQNVLYGDLHCERQTDPYCGVARDNIYTYGPSGLQSPGLGVVGGPISKDDSVLLPIASIDPGARLDPWTRARQQRIFDRNVWYAFISLTLVMVVWRIYVQYRKSIVGRRPL